MDDLGVLKLVLAAVFGGYGAGVLCLLALIARVKGWWFDLPYVKDMRQQIAERDARIISLEQITERATTAGETVTAKLEAPPVIKIPPNSSVQATPGSSGGLLVQPSRVLPPDDYAPRSPRRSRGNGSVWDVPQASRPYDRRNASGSGRPYRLVGPARDQARRVRRRF